mmetsp:Transcript_12055/g.35193  ORF Transcript_12055/g.35193 Transcript_12055/m.35193 type:complete len:210 (+) Transcript_12055:411-1040(+)
MTGPSASSARCASPRDPAWVAPSNPAPSRRGRSPSSSEFPSWGPITASATSKWAGWRAGRRTPSSCTCRGGTPRSSRTVTSGTVSSERRLTSPSGTASIGSRGSLACRTTPARGTTSSRRRRREIPSSWNCLTSLRGWTCHFPAYSRTWSKWRREISKPGKLRWQISASRSRRPSSRCSSKSRSVPWPIADRSKFSSWEGWGAISDSRK